MVVTWQQGNSIHVWDIGEGRLRFEPITSSPSTPDLSFPPDPDGKPGLFAAVEFLTAKSAVRFFDLQTGKPALSPIPLATDASSARFTDDGRRLLVGCLKGKSARLYDWRSGEAMCPEVAHEAGVWSAATVPGSSWCLTGDALSKLWVWDGNTGRLLMPPWGDRGKIGPLVDIKVTPDGRFAILTRYNSNEIPILNLRALREEFPLDAEGARLLAEINAAAWVHPGGDTVRLDPGGWMERWQEFRRRYPTYHHYPGGK